MHASHYKKERQYQNSTLKMVTHNGWHPHLIFQSVFLPWVLRSAGGSWPLAVVSTLLKIFCSCSLVREFTLSFASASLPAPFSCRPIFPPVPLFCGPPVFSLALREPIAEMCLSDLTFGINTKRRWQILLLIVNQKSKVLRFMVNLTLATTLPVSPLIWSCDFVDVRAVLLLPLVVLEVKETATPVLISLWLPAHCRAGCSFTCTSSTHVGCLMLRMLAALGLQISYKVIINKTKKERKIK